MRTCNRKQETDDPDDRELRADPCNDQSEAGQGCQHTVDSTLSCSAAGQSGPQFPGQIRIGCGKFLFELSSRLRSSSDNPIGTFLLHYGVCAGGCPLGDRIYDRSQGLALLSQGYTAAPCWTRGTSAQT